MRRKRQHRQCLLLLLLQLLLPLGSFELNLRRNSRSSSSSKSSSSGSIKCGVSAFLPIAPHLQALPTPSLQLSKLHAKKQGEQPQQQQHHRDAKQKGLEDRGILKPSKRTAPAASEPSISQPPVQAAAAAAAAATAALAEAGSANGQSEEQVLYNDPLVCWTPASLSPFQVSPELLQQLRPARAAAAASTAAAVTPWASIAASRFVDAAADTFVPKAAAAADARAAREAAWRAAQEGATQQRIAAAAAEAVAAASASPTAAEDPAAAQDPGPSDDLWGDVESLVRRLLREEEEAEREKDAGVERDAEASNAEGSKEADVDISVEPRFIPDEWTDVPRPFLNSTAISTLSASHLSKPDIDSAECGGRNKLSLQFISPLERKRQAFWLNALNVAVRSMESRAAAAGPWLRRQHNLQRNKQYKSSWRLEQERRAERDENAGEDTSDGADGDAPPPPFPLPPGLTNINHRFHNAFKLMNAAGWSALKACLDLPTPHSRLECWRLGSELRRLYFSRFDSRVSIRRKLLWQDLKEYVLPHADMVLVMRDGIVDSSLSRGNGFIASQLADQEEVGGVAVSRLEGIEAKNPHHQLHQTKAAPGEKCGCDDAATAPAVDTHTAGTAIAQEEEASAEEEEGLDAICCSFFDLQDAAVRAAIERELRFIPEYSNYYRKNTQAFHRGQIGKTSRKYDNDYSIYDYRKLDFGMAKFSALNLAGMHDSGVVIVADRQEDSSSREAKAEAAAAAAADQKATAETPVAAHDSSDSGRKSGQPKPLTVQVIHVTTMDEADALNSADNSSNTKSGSSDRTPATPLINPRVVIHVGKNARCQVHQTHVSMSSLLAPAERSLLHSIKERRKRAQADQPQAKGFRGPFVNSATRVVVEEGAELHHVYAQELDEDTAHFESLSISCQRGASYKLTLVDMGAALSRFAMQVEGAEGSSHVSRGVSLLHGDQDHSKYEMLHHLDRDAETDQVHKSLVAGKARAIWKGRIRVEREATGTSASSLNRVILLEDGARCVAVPTLEIIPEEIKKATHGAAIRDFDTEPLFYMMSRGLPVLEAKRLLMLAFVDDVVGPLNDTGLTTRVRSKVLSMVPKNEKGGITRHHMFRGGDAG
ncbi:hypothetical protein Efla_003552 [Eimeria flavescens]